MALAALFLGLGAWWARSPDPAKPDDTGMDPQAQQELLQEIGYLK